MMNKSVFCGEGRQGCQFEESLGEANIVVLRKSESNILVAISDVEYNMLCNGSTNQKTAL